MASSSGTSRALPAASLARLLEQIARTLHSRGHAAELYPAQWTALRYFSQAEPQQRNASDLARFQGIEPGPVTRTVRTLITKGYLERAGSLGRGRTQRIELTQTGRELLQLDPLKGVVTAIDGLSREDKRALAVGLEAVLRSLQAERDAP